MAYIHKPGTGSLFPNNKKLADNHPDMRGAVMIGDVEYTIGAWKRMNTRGEYFSLSISEKRGTQVSERRGNTYTQAIAETVHRAAPVDERDDLEDSDVPF